MTITLNNKEALDLRTIRGVHVVKMLDINDRGRLYARYWSVIIFRPDSSKVHVSSFPLDAFGLRQAKALRMLISEFITNNTKN